MMTQTLYRITRRSALARNILLATPMLSGPDGPARHPNLVIIGAQKSGTTSLHRFLDRHLDIFMPHFKEPGYFLNPDPTPIEGTSRAKIRLGLSNSRLLRMMKLGYRGERWFGDGSTYYTMPMGAEVPENIATRSPDARLIYILRNPYDRIVSQYLWGLQNDFAQGRLNEMIERRFDVMTAISSYATQYRRYAAHVDPSRILLLRFDHLKKDPVGTLTRVTDFLDLPALPADDTAFAPQNASRQRKSFGKDDLTFSPEIAERLQAVIEPQIADLAAETGFDVTGWSRG